MAILHKRTINIGGIEITSASQMARQAFWRAKNKQEKLAVDVALLDALLPVPGLPTVLDLFLEQEASKEFDLEEATCSLVEEAAELLLTGILAGHVFHYQAKGEQHAISANLLADKIQWSLDQMVWLRFFMAAEFEHLAKEFGFTPSGRTLLRKQIITKAMADDPFAFEFFDEIRAPLQRILARLSRRNVFVRFVPPSSYSNGHQTLQ